MPRGEQRVQILLTGGSGLLGAELLNLGVTIVAPTHQELDICDADAVVHYIETVAPDLFIHAAAVTDNRHIESHPESALDVNIVGTTNIARACLGTRIRLVYLSTDYVYSGNRGDYSESDELLPSNLYAWSKLAGEAAVRAVPNHLIIRTSFGAARFDYPAAFIDKYSSKEYVDLIAPEILEAALSPLTGVLNVGGRRRTLYDYASERNPQVAKISLAESPHASPADTSLSTDLWQQYKSGKGVVKAVTACRVCGNRDLEKYLDLGMMPLANNLAPSALAARQMRRFPMQVQVCRECALSQLTVVVDPRQMFSHYTYRSSVNKGYVRHCRKMARTVGRMLELGEGDLVVDIAGNDGSLLLEFRDELGVDVLNVDPAGNIAALARERGVETINDFWSPQVAANIVADKGRPRLLTATNVFAHVDDVRTFVKAAKDCLDERGALMLEFPYAIDFIENREFDTIYFEHLSYVLIRPVARLASELGMEVFDVQKQEIHGGTVRVFLALEGRRPVTAAVTQFLETEKRGGFLGVDRYLGWRAEIDGLIDDLRTRLAALKANGATIAAFAASAKGNTLLNACRFDVSTIDYIVDDTPEKIGMFSPGNGIPIVDRERLKTQRPDYLIILAWNFAQEIIDNTPEFGGRYIIPIPEFRVVG
jgi:dTDP-4-dehydrorhamnose reductase